MKIGDKVILRKFEDSESLSWFDAFYSNVGKVVKVEVIDEEDKTFMFKGCWWLNSACDVVISSDTIQESKEDLCIDVSAYESCSETVKNERYFFFTYVSGNKTGNIWMKNTEGKFPSNSFIVEYLKKKHTLDTVIITNIFEFKSEQDFLDFTSNE